MMPMPEVHNRPDPDLGVEKDHADFALRQNSPVFAF
jgi:hypothetical protein